MHLEILVTSKKIKSAEKCNTIRQNLILSHIVCSMSRDKRSQEDGFIYLKTIYSITYKRDGSTSQYFLNSSLSAPGKLSQGPRTSEMRQWKSVGLETRAASSQPSKMLIRLESSGLFEQADMRQLAKWQCEFGNRSWRGSSSYSLLWPAGLCKCGMLITWLYPPPLFWDRVYFFLGTSSHCNHSSSRITRFHLFLSQCISYMSSGYLRLLVFLRLQSFISFTLPFVV